MLGRGEGTERVGAGGGFVDVVVTPGRSWEVEKGTLLSLLPLTWLAIPAHELVNPYG